MPRETREETGLRLTEYAYRGVVRYLSEDQDEPMHLFTATGFTRDMIDCNDGLLAWMPADEASLWRCRRVTGYS